jgi:glycosyltransferase involved in cell wall biosynthesis
MRLCVNVEDRLLRTPDGQIWARGTFAYRFWKRYLDVFDQLRVIARVADVSTLPEGTWKRSDGDAVIFHALPSYMGPLQYARSIFSVAARVRSAIGNADAVIMRVPSPIASHIMRQLARTRPFGLEVLGDPHQVFAPGSIVHPLRPFLRWYSTRQLKHECRKACAVAYVAAFLRCSYPAPRQAFSTTFSSIELEEDAFSPNCRRFGPHSDTVRVISVGTLEVLYKGFDVLIDAVSACIQAGLKLELVIVGSGRLRPQLERYAQVRGLGDRVKFTGRLPAGEPVRKELDGADLFVLASKTEGLPRAMIEAMARGLPCIGTAVGGIPELLDPEDLVPRGNASALAEKITEVIHNPARMTRMSAANLMRARDYHTSVLSPRRRQFYAYLREATQEWHDKSRRMAVRLDVLEQRETLRVERSSEEKLRSQ